MVALHAQIYLIINSFGGGQAEALLILFRVQLSRLKIRHSAALTVCSIFRRVHSRYQNKTSWSYRIFTIQIIFRTNKNSCRPPKAWIITVDRFWQ
jgi:hypothetical protein